MEEMFGLLLRGKGQGRRAAGQVYGGVRAAPIRCEDVYENGIVQDSPAPTAKVRDKSATGGALWAGHQSGVSINRRPDFLLCGRDGKRVKVHEAISWLTMDRHRPDENVGITSQTTGGVQEI
jgi:hypothetical protein